MTKHGNLKTTVFGGEALLLEITGPGMVFIQTKNVMEFARALMPFLPLGVAVPAAGHGDQAEGGAIPTEGGHEGSESGVDWWFG